MIMMKKIAEDVEVTNSFSLHVFGNIFRAMWKFLGSWLDSKLAMMMACLTSSYEMRLHEYHF